jgi:putative DNA primase/helicase
MKRSTMSNTPQIPLLDAVPSTPSSLNSPKPASIESELANIQDEKPKTLARDLKPTKPSPIKNPAPCAATEENVIEPTTSHVGTATTPLIEVDTASNTLTVQPQEKPTLDMSEKVPVEKFIDVDLNNQPMKTMTNVAAMLTFYNITARYNVIKKDFEMIIPGQECCPDTAANTALTVLASLATLNGIYSGNFERFIFALASKNPFNPVMKFIESKPWDGKDRIKDLINTITTEEQNFVKYLKPILIIKWLLSCVAAASMPKGFSCRGVLVLQGAQGIGKTRWIASLIGDPTLREEVIKLDHHLDGNNKDSILNAIRHWVVEIGELDSTFKKDVARLKGFITNDSDKIRLPYDRRESEYPRRTVFAATVNASDFLVDPTGSSRWWTLPCIAINYEHKIDTQQLWAQVYVLLNKGGEDAQWWLKTEEQELLEDCNGAHQIINAISDQLAACLDFDSSKTDWRKASATEVLQQIGIERPTNAHARDCGTYLRQELGEPNRSQGKNRWLTPPNIDRDKAATLEKEANKPKQSVFDPDYTPGDDEY